jgi:hypothetical protein
MDGQEEYIEHTASPPEDGQADKLLGIAPEAKKNPDMRRKFSDAVRSMDENIANGVALTPDLIEKYNIQIGGRGFADERSRQAVSSLLNGLTREVVEVGQPTLEGLAEFYDRFNLRQPLLDGNKRTSSLAVAHVLREHGYSVPDFRTTGPARLSELRRINQGDVNKATTQFLKESLPVAPPHRAAVLVRQ